jgi:hypothetical protein
LPHLHSSQMDLAHISVGSRKRRRHLPEVPMAHSTHRTANTAPTSLALFERMRTPPYTSPATRSRGAPAISASPHCSWPAAAFQAGPRAFRCTRYGPMAGADANRPRALEYARRCFSC